MFICVCIYICTAGSLLTVSAGFSLCTMMAKWDKDAGWSNKKGCFEKDNPVDEKGIELTDVDVVDHSLGPDGEELIEPPNVSRLLMLATEDGRASFVAGLNNVRASFSGNRAL